jgi:hypothetical protein
VFCLGDRRGLPISHFDVAIGTFHMFVGERFWHVIDVSMKSLLLSLWIMTHHGLDRNWSIYRQNHPSCSFWFGLSWTQSINLSDTSRSVRISQLLHACKICVNPVSGQDFTMIYAIYSRQYWFVMRVPIWHFQISMILRHRPEKTKKYVRVYHDSS